MNIIRNQLVLAPSFALGDGVLHFGGGGVEGVVVGKGEAALGRFEARAGRELGVELHNKINFCVWFIDFSDYE